MTSNGEQPKAHLLNTNDLQKVAPGAMSEFLDTRREQLDWSLPRTGQVLFTVGLGYAGARAFKKAATVIQQRRAMQCRGPMRCGGRLRFVGAVAFVAFITQKQCPVTSSQDGSRCRGCSHSGHTHSTQQVERVVADQAADNSNTRGGFCPFTSERKEDRAAATEAGEVSPAAEAAKDNKRGGFCPFTSKRAEEVDGAAPPAVTPTDRMAKFFDACYLGFINDKLGPGGLPGDSATAAAAASLGVWWGMRVL